MARTAHKPLKYRTYKTERGAIRYRDSLIAKWPGRIFHVIPDPLPTFRYVVGYLIDRDGTPLKYAICS